MEKINIAELLKNCPKGMELDCTMYDNAKFIGIENNDKPICIEIGNGDLYFSLTKFGTWNFDKNSKCVVFPKGKTNWEGFVPPCKFKDGDVCYVKTKTLFEYIFIFKVSKNYACTENYVALSAYDLYTDISSVCTTDSIKEIRLATEEEKQKLFDSIKANAYHWNEETKTLEKLIEPSTNEKFYIRIGDIPSEQKSSVYNGDVVVGYEDGMSVYDCIETDGVYRIVMPLPLKEGQGMTYECLIQEITQCRYEIEKPRNVYLVSGMEVGKGHDNEPLIKNVKILKDLTRQFNPKNDNTKEAKTLEKITELNDGDIVTTEIGSIFIYNKMLNNQDYFGCYVGLSCIKSKTPKIIIMDQFSFKNNNLRLATEEEKQKLFRAIKNNGYKWNENTKTLEKLVDPCFKVGDRIKDVRNNSKGIILKINNDSYECRCNLRFDCKNQYQ